MIIMHRDIQVFRKLRGSWRMKKRDIDLDYCQYEEDHLPGMHVEVLVIQDVYLQNSTRKFLTQLKTTFYKE
jgi:hypothetical protein